jgi:hypothetical protein
MRNILGTSTLIFSSLIGGTAGAGGGSNDFADTPRALRRPFIQVDTDTPSRPFIQVDTDTPSRPFIRVDTDTPSRPFIRVDTDGPSRPLIHARRRPLEAFEVIA